MVAPPDILQSAAGMTKVLIVDFNKRLFEKQSLFGKIVHPGPKVQETSEATSF